MKTCINCGCSIYWVDSHWGEHARWIHLSYGIEECFDPPLPNEWSVLVSKRKIPWTFAQQEPTEGGITI